MTLSTRLVASIFAQREHGLSAAMRRKTLLHIADNVAIAIAARQKSPLAALVRDSFAGPGGQAGASGPGLYAFATSAYGHILDFDDIHDVARVHPTAVTLPAALAVVPLMGATLVPGRDLVDAVALSNELLCRLGLIWLPAGRGPGSDWFLTQLFGYFAAALAAGIVLRLDACQMRSALGLAYMQAAGGKEAGFGTGGNARAVYPAFAAMGGVQAALLARAGIIGPGGALDGDANLFRLYFGRDLDDAQSALLLDTRATVWADTRIKPWPSCRHSHPYIFAARGLRAGLDLASVERVEVSVNRSAGKLCTPIEQRRVPQTLQDAKYSIPFVVAFTLVHGEVDLETLNESALTDARVLAMAQRVFIHETGGDESGLPHARITAFCGGAQASVKTFDDVFDAPDSEQMVRAKFRACLAYAGMPAGETEAAWQAITGLGRGDSAALSALMAVAA
jgi:2-methylcitrate dehydratase PrpD